MQITPNHSKAAAAIVELIAEKIGTGREIHPATAISSCARLAGSFMFRSFNFTMENATPGSAVLSDMANEKGPALMSWLGNTLSNFGVNPDPQRMQSASPQQSNLSFVEALEQLQDEGKKIMEANNLDQEQMAYSCAMATAFIIKECKNDLPAETGFQTAVYGFVEGTKTYPPEYGTQSKKKGIFKFWK